MSTPGESVGGAAAAGRGVGVYVEFSQKISGMAAFVARNNLGLKHMLSYTSETPDAELVEGRPIVRQQSIQELKRKTLAKRRFLYLGGIAIFLALFWRAARTAQDWEAAAMGATLMLVLMTPANYYLGFVLAAALLATRRPRIGIALMGALAGWGLAFIEYGREPMAYVLSSAIGLVFFLYVLLEMQAAPTPRPAVLDPAP